MLAAHVGPPPDAPTGWLLTVFHGRSAALFLFLAGLSLALISGGVRPVDALTLRRARIKIAVRAGVLLALGLALSSLVEDQVDVILPVYAVLFLLAMPLLRLRPRPLLVMAGVLAVLGPVLSYLVRDALGLAADDTPAAPSLSALASWRELGDGELSVLLNGAYPVLVVLPITLVGLAVGRLDLSAWSVRRRLLGFGVVAAVLGYGGSALVVRFVGLPALIGVDSAAAAQHQLHAVTLAEAGTVPTTSWGWLLTAAPHSGTPMEVLGAIGCALAVLGAALVIAERAPTVLYPVLAVGMMPLTAYTAHLLAIWAIAASGGDSESWPVLAAFVLAVMTFAVFWLRYFRSGPLERALSAIANGRLRPAPHRRPAPTR
jgi:uncharacterized membrane protein YeiB